MANALNDNSEIASADVVMMRLADKVDLDVNIKSPNELKYKV
ncbi:hypothetical protein GCM10007978_42260 [Shewanella hanedai]|nr:hypothetical protein GCM10007978_42260 [Shewanella hanedai]